jgi:MraZ protein
LWENCDFNGKFWVIVVNTGGSLSGFYGQYQTTMDDKGRFALPAKLRAVLGPDKIPLLDGNLILTKGLEGCLSLYSEPEWQDIQERLSTIPFTRKDYRFFSRRFYSSASLVSPDRNGRILIPAHLIKEADLGKELLVIGVNRLIEIWNPKRLQDYQDAYAATYEEVAERLFTADGGER